MSYTLSQAIEQLASRSTVAELIDLVHNTSAQVEGAPSNATSLLYSGTVNGTGAVPLSEALVDSTENEAGARRLVRVDETSVGRLLEDTDFKRKLQAAVEADLASKIPGFADLPVAERLAVRNAEIFRITAKDTLIYEPHPAR